MLEKNPSVFFTVSPVPVQQEDGGAVDTGRDSKAKQ